MIWRLAIRPPSRTTQLEDLPPEGQGPSPDELVAFDGETTDAFIARTGAPEPARLALTDAVPVLRGDLEIVKGKSPGLFEVGEAGGRHFTLYEFELSIARMLDGRRHASDVIENGVRLGIPVDLDGLNKFIRQLWRYGFLAQPGSAPIPVEGEEAGWGERVKWDEATRTLFQTGLRLMRQGRPQDAESYFHAVLDADPGNAEATELLAAIQRGETVSASPIGQRPGGRKAAGIRRGRASGIALAAGAMAVAGAVAAAAFAARRPPLPAAPPPIVAPAPLPRPPPVWRTAAVLHRAHPPVGEIAAPEDGIILWKVKGGAPVAKGQRLGILRTVVGGPGGTRIDPASAARIKELETLANQDPIYRDFLEKERRALQRRPAARAQRDLPILAPAAGAVSFAVESRSRVERGATLAAVLDESAWVVEAFLDGEAAAAGATCELRGDAIAERIACALESARPAPGGNQLVVNVPAAAAPWLEPSRSLRVRIAPPGTPPEPDPRGEDAP
jgi:hypothetical protein